MRKILIFACFMALAVAQTSDELFQQVTSRMTGAAEECIQELGLPDDPELLDRFVTERQSNDVEVMGALRACALKKVGALVDGEIITDVFDEILDQVAAGDEELKEKLDELHARCKRETEHITSENELALAFVNCASAGLDEIADETQ